MRRVRWSDEARPAQRAWLDGLESQDSRLTDRALAESETLSLKTGSRPFTYRPSRWSGLREASLLRWHKIIVFQVLPEEVVVVSFYDSRQDFDRAQPTLESH